MNDRRREVHNNMLQQIREHGVNRQEQRREENGREQRREGQANVGQEQGQAQRQAIARGLRRHFLGEP